MTSVTSSRVCRSLPRAQCTSGGQRCRIQPSTCSLCGTTLGKTDLGLHWVGGGATDAFRSVICCEPISGLGGEVGEATNQTIQTYWAAQLARPAIFSTQAYRVRLAFPRSQHILSTTTATENGPVLLCSR